MKMTNLPWFVIQYSSCTNITCTYTENKPFIEEGTNLLWPRSNPHPTLSVSSSNPYTVWNDDTWVVQKQYNVMLYVNQEKTKKRPTFDMGCLCHICYFTCGPFQTHIHLSRPVVQHHCLKGPTSICYAQQQWIKPYLNCHWFLTLAKEQMCNFNCIYTFIAYVLKLFLMFTEHSFEWMFNL